MHRTLCNFNLFLESAHTEWLPTFITVYLLTLEADITYLDIILRDKGSVHVIFGCQWRLRMYLRRSVDSYCSLAKRLPVIILSPFNSSFCVDGHTYISFDILRTPFRYHVTSCHDNNVANQIYFCSLMLGSFSLASSKEKRGPWS